MANQAAAAVIEAARSRGLRIALAESITGGAIADALVAVPGASDVFLGSIVSYSTALKKSLLGVEDSHLETAGAVSEAVALQMARGVANLVAESKEQVPRGLVTLAVTGVAGPAGQDGQPVGLVWFGLTAPGREETLSRLFSGDRSAIRQQAVGFALEWLREAIESTLG